MMLDGGHGILSSALKTIRARWDVVEPHWQDLLRQQFVEQVWGPSAREHGGRSLRRRIGFRSYWARCARECEGTSVDIYSGD